MKNLFFKKMMPLVVFVLGIAGAFGTMSMQHADVAVGTVSGWHINAGVPCSLEKQCSDIPSAQFCRINYSVPNSPMAFDKSSSGCATPYYRL